MPGIIVDPRQNEETQKRYGVILLNGNYVAYDKNDDEDLPYLPAGWRIQKRGIVLEPFSGFSWEERWIGIKVRSESVSNLLVGQERVLAHTKSAIKSEIDKIPRDPDWS